MKPTISLAIIAKDEVEELKRLLQSVISNVNEVIIVTDHNRKIKRLARKYKAKYYDFTWVKDFSRARNFSFSKCSCDYILWADCDDTIYNAKNLSNIAQEMKEKNIDWACFKYNYAQDVTTNEGIADHWKPRLIKNDGSSVWQKRIHENLVHKGLYTYENFDDVTVIHHYRDEDHYNKELRNYEILINEYEECKENTDPRTLHYLGNSSLGLALSGKSKNKEQLLKQAIYFYKKHIEKSGWEDETYFSYVKSGMAMVYLNNYEDAKKAFVASTLIKPTWADAYWYLCMASYDVGQYENAIEYGEMALQKRIPKTPLTINNTLYTYTGLSSLVRAYLMCNKPKEALAVVSTMQHNKQTQELYNICKDADNLEDYAQSMMRVIDKTIKYDNNSIHKLINGIPNILMGDLRIQEKIYCLKEVKHWENKTIVIYCGRTSEDWADHSTINGIGGSETAVIHISRELVKLGYKVTVYNSCNDMAGIYNGVEYKPYWEFNPRDFFNNIILWRCPQLALAIDNANKIWVWNHDKVDNDNFNKEIINKVDKFIFLSKWQRKQVSTIPDNKVLLSKNGLDIDNIKFNLENNKINKHQIIYASSYDRGLIYLLRQWKKIKQAVPDATLRIFYGWNTFDAVRKDDKSLKFKEEVQELMKQPGIYHGGRIGQQQLNKEFAQSDIWAYPTDFWEISCIVAMNAQCSGTIPVCTNYAALSETVKYGYKVSGIKEINGMTDKILNKWTNKLIEVLQSNNEDLRNRMIIKSQKRFEWKKVAKQWKKLLD